MENFKNIYQPNAKGKYSVEDIYKMQDEILKELNNFNQGYSNYKKYLYNKRHDQKGDTSKKFILYDLSGNIIEESQFYETVKDYNNLNQSKLYNNLVSDLKIFNKALTANKNANISKNKINSSLNDIKKTHKEVLNLRNHLDEKLIELNNKESNIYIKRNVDMESSILRRIILTTFASGLIIYVFFYL